MGTARIRARNGASVAWTFKLLVFATDICVSVYPETEEGRSASVHRTHTPYIHTGLTLQYSTYRLHVTTHTATHSQSSPPCDHPQDNSPREYFPRASACLL